MRSIARRAAAGPLMPSAATSLIACRRLTSSSSLYDVPPTSSSAASTAPLPPSMSAFTVPLGGSPIPPYPGYIADEDDAEFAAQIEAERAVSAKRAERHRQKPIATSPDDDQVDPFRVGYNMGMQNVQLETLRHKLDDNQELVKSHLTSLRETTRTNYDSLRRLHNEHHRLILDEIKDNDERLTAKFVAYGSTFAANEEQVRDASKLQLEAMQRHMDDRLENIKDTVKIGTFILIAINIGGLFYISQQLQQQNGGAGPTGRRPVVAASAAPSGSPPSVQFYQQQAQQKQQQQQR